MGFIMNIPVSGISGINVSSAIKTVALPKAAWTKIYPYTNTIALADIKANSIVYCTPLIETSDSPELIKEYQKLSATIGDGSIIFKTEIPITHDINISLSISNL